MPNSGYKFVSQNCAELMRHAIEQFFESENQDKKRSRPVTLFTRMKKYIDPAWIEYSKQVSTDTCFGNLICGFLPSEYAKEKGFLRLEDWCIDTIRRMNQEPLLAKEETSIELYGTIAELRSVALKCRLMKSKFRPVTNNNQSRNFNIQNTPLFCRICSAPTELRMFAATPSTWVNEDFDARRPSKIFCADHRPVRSNSSKISSSYQQFLRQEKLIEIEFARLHRQSFSWHEPRAESGNALVDEFIRLTAQKNFLYPDDEPLFQQLANKIVKSRVKDTKKKIVVALRSGKTQAEVAKLMGISQQSVFKAVAKIPKEFRFDQELKK
ncbi:hypothetical protein H8K52_05225 [Undibacterium seohonense]|uniref:Uncharacterized protein n=1 Tax=Undibacterium seohonense TaxID=1344950 RepID=A0ABR6X1F5_9BURK|nr:hypothetical protein [Undibacterium seohonense]MBC3806747.1 hypothetical protein [Undibacterium seohonense]